MEKTLCLRRPKRSRHCSWIAGLALLATIFLLPTNLVFGDEPTWEEPPSYTHKGKPFFPITLYHYRPEDPYGLNHLEEISNAGFNVIRHRADWEDGVTRQELDKYHSYGLNLRLACTEWFNNLDNFKPTISNWIENVGGDHPSFFAYETADEPYWQKISTLEELNAAKDYIILKDPHPDNTNIPLHPILCNFADYEVVMGGGNQCGNPAESCSLAGFREWVSVGTVYSMDVYPVTCYDFPNNGLTRVTEGFDILKSIVQMDENGNSRPAKPQGMILQSCTWNQMSQPDKQQVGWDKYPTIEETRFMAFASIIHGARSIEWYGVSHIASEDLNTVWGDIKTVAGEVAKLQDVLAGGVTISSSNYTIPGLENPADPASCRTEAICKQYPAGNGPKYLIVANVCPGVRNKDITFPGWAGKKIRDLISGEVINVNSQGTFSDDFGGWGVKVYAPDALPFGVFATPADGSTVCSSIPVTGWALDNLGVKSVKIKVRRPGGSSLTYIGDAVFVEGARPDIELAYPDYPNNAKAGWGYMMLTHFLPALGQTKGSGTYELHAIATDMEGNDVTLGTKTITVDNNPSTNPDAVKPFGAIDTPAQGGEAYGSAYRVWGWALTPQPNSIPTDGSTINVFVDGVSVGQPIYNIYREDIATLFPGYENSNGAVGYFDLDTTQYNNGTHTIAWSVEDNAGNADGIGSRYFTIYNPPFSGSGGSSSSDEPASLTGPMPGTKLSGSSETFGWSAGSDVSAYKIDVGTSPGGNDIHDGSSTTLHWEGVSGLPDNGATIYVRLSSQINGDWVNNDYAYEAAGNPVVQQPEIALNKSTISRSVTEGQNLSGDTFQVRNSGIGTLDYTIGDNKTWLSVSPTSGSSTGEWDTINVNYSTTNLTVGTYTAVITVSAPNTAAKTLTVSLVVNDPNSPIAFENIGEMAGGDPRTRIWGRRGITNADISGGPIAVGRGSDGGEGNGFTAFRWQNSAFVGLPRTGATPYSSNSWGYGISADGSVVYGGDFDNDTSSRAVVWTNTGSGWANANKIVLNGSSGWGALSANGTAIVDYSNGVAYKFTTADNWATAGGVSRTTLTGMTTAYGCSSDGSIVVGTDASGPAIFNGPNGAHTKVSLPGSGTCYAVSDDGTVVAGISPTNIYGKDEPCKWVYANGTWEKTILPLLPGMVPETNGKTGSAFMVSADGSRIAGQFREYGDYYIPLIWENGGVQKLEDILNSAGVYLAPGWYFADLGAMSPDGRTFGGSMSDQPYGSADNNRHAWIATINDSGGAVLFDSGFETASGWTFSTSGSFPGTSVLRSTWGIANEHSGSYALALSNQANAKPVTDFIAAGPGSHTISAWVRGEMEESSSGGWVIRAYFYDSNQQALSPAWQDASKCTGSDSCLSTTWTEKSGTVDAPAGTAYIKIKLLFYMAGGWVAYDDVSLDGQPLTVAAHGVDGGFETGTGWSFDTSGSFPGTSVLRSTWGIANEHSGSYALALSNQANAKPVTDFIAAGPGSHTISAWVRGEMEESSFGGWIIRAYFYDGNQQALSPAWQDATACSGSAGCLSTTWTEKSGTVDAPAGTAYIKIRLFFYMAGGWVAYDDVSLDGQPLSVTVHGVDGGFETETGWSFDTSGSFPGTSVFRSTGGTASKHSGSYALALSNQAYAQPVTDFIAASPGSYTVSAWVRGEMEESSFGGWIIRAFFYDSNKQALSPAWQNAAACTGSAGCLSTTWSEKSGTVDAPAGTAYIKLRLYFYMAGGWVAYDDVEIVKSD